MVWERQQLATNHPKNGTNCVARDSTCISLKPIRTIRIIRSRLFVTFSREKDQPPTRNPMGRGDKRSKKGKIYSKSYGKRRPRKLKKKPAPKKA